LNLIPCSRLPEKGYLKFQVAFVMDGMLAEKNDDICVEFAIYLT